MKKGASPALDDESIVGLVLQGAQEEFHHLVERHQAALYRFIYLRTWDPEESRELAQEAFLLAYRQLPQFDRSRASFKTWLYWRALSAVKQWRGLKATREKYHDREIEAVTATAPGSPEAEVIAGMQAECVEERLSRIPEKQRVVVVLWLRENLSDQEISDVLGGPRDRVKKRRQRAVEDLWPLLEECL